jgi:hypothetical protein
MLAQLQAASPRDVKYWGTSSGGPLPEPYGELFRWTAQQVREYQDVLASWPLTTSVEIDGLGKVLFCHATPRNETEIFTRLTPEERLAPVFAGVDASVVVCGHTHMQFDRMVGGLRVVNAGSVGMPFGTTGADWLMLGPGIETAKNELRHHRRSRDIPSHRVSDGRGDGGALHPQSADRAGTLRCVGTGGGVMRSVRLQPDLRR